MEIFGNFGNVIFCDFPMDKQKSWINTSMAYVEFEKLEEADECVKKMYGGMQYSRNMINTNRIRISDSFQIKKLSHKKLALKLGIQANDN